MKKSLLSPLLLLCLMFPFGASAQPYFSQVVFFGDSLSDTGNLACREGPLSPEFSFGGLRASNGPLAVEHLAASLGFPIDANPSFYLDNNYCPLVARGNNYAVGGATAIWPGAKDLLSQVVNFWVDNSYKTDKNTLYVFFIGGNDLIAASEFPPFIADIFIDVAVDNIAASIDLLKSWGARHFLIVQGPDVGKIPLINEDPGRAALATALSAAFNDSLQARLHRLERGPAHIIGFDVFRFMTELLASGSFGNTSDACLDALPDSASSCTSIEFFPFVDFDFGYFFLDERHPTATVQRLLGEELSACFGIGPGSGAYCIDAKHYVEN